MLIVLIQLTLLNMTWLLKPNSARVYAKCSFPYDIHFATSSINALPLNAICRELDKAWTLVRAPTVLMLLGWLWPHAW